MKNKEEFLIVKAFKRVINIRSWFDYDRIRAFTLYLLTGAKKLVVPQPKAPDHSFDEVMKKLNLTEKDMTLKKNALWRLSMVMLGCAFLIFIYAGYSLFQGTWITALVSLVMMCLALVFAFRYHFWYFQMCERRLGCTFREWYTKGLRGKNS